jgi:hypothetical protein
MPKQSIILGFNYHLPAGASEKLFERIYRSRLKTFFQILYEYPRIPFTLHLSGTLLYRIERVYGEFFMLISDMLKRRQLELLGGGFYEPMMPFLHHPDRIGQIELLTTYLRKHFSKRVNGCWIPDSAWEQSLVSAIAGSGLSYGFVDERRFIDAGLSEDQYTMPCVSEDKGKFITVFPLFSRLGTAMRERGAVAAMEELGKKRGKENFVRAVFPDFFPSDKEAENEAFIRRFFEDLSRFEDRFTFSLPTRELPLSEARQRVYFRQTIDKKYTVDFPEAGMIYAKMTHTKTLIEQLKGDKERKLSAREELWKAQDFSLFCYDDQCENFFSNAAGGARSAGVACASLRNASYSAVLGAERITREKIGWLPSLAAYDLNFDGALEFLFQGKKMNCYVRPLGASLFELDYMPVNWNYQNTLSLPLRPAAPFPRDIETSFSDLILPAESESYDGSASAGSRFLGGEIYKLVSLDRIHQTAVFNLDTHSGPFGGIALVKTCKLNGNIFTVHYKLTNTSGEKAAFTFLTKINLSFPSADEKLLRLFTYNSYTSFSNNGEKTAVAHSETSIPDLMAIDFQDLRNELIINVSCEEKFDAHLHEVKSAHRNIFGETIEEYQWTRLCPRVRRVLDAGAETELCFKLAIYR